METNSRICKACGGKEFIKLGVKPVKGGIRQRYQCKNRACGCIVIGEMITREPVKITPPVIEKPVEAYSKEKSLKVKGKVKRG